MMDEPQILRPFNRAEVLLIAQAALLAGCSVRTMRDWCLRYDLGRKVRGRWYVSKVALAIYLDGDWGALNAYLAGDRSSSIVSAYFERCGVPLPRRQNPTPNDSREDKLSEANPR